MPRKLLKVSQFVTGVTNRRTLAQVQEAQVRRAEALEHSPAKEILDMTSPAANDVIVETSQSGQNRPLCAAASEIRLTVLAIFT